MPRNLIRLLAALILSVPTLALAADVKHNYDLKNVFWKLGFSMQDQSIIGDVTNTLTLNEVSPTVQLSCAELNVSRVTVNNRDAQFTNADGVLTVTLPMLGKKGQTLNVRTIYTGSPVTGLYFVQKEHAFPAHTGMIYTQGEGEDNHYWLPTYDKPDDKATTECYITVPKGWTAISNGRLIDVTSSVTQSVWHWKMDQPFSTYLISLVAGPYVKGGDSWHGIPVDYYVPPGLQEQGEQSFIVTSKMIDLYSKLTGVDYPYPKFAQETVADFMFGGMENITAVTQTIRTLHALGTEPVNDSEYLVAHELAHQWFGDLVTCRTWEHMWLNEGFATTLPTFWDRATKGQSAFDLDRYSNLEGSVDTSGSRGRKDVPGEVGASPSVSIGSPYAGGSARIMMLFHMLGEDVFWKGIHAYLEKYKFQPATTEDFFNVMSKSSGKDLHPFEKQWYHTPVTPSLTVSIDGSDLVVKQFAPYYTLDLPVWVMERNRDSLGRLPPWRKLTVHVSGAESRLTLPDRQSDFSPDNSPAFLVDPEAWTPMEISYDYKFSRDSIQEMYGYAPNDAERARIVAEFFDKIPVKARIALCSDEKSIGLRQMILSHIGADGLDFLVANTRDADQRIVNSAVLALGKLSQNDNAQAALEAIAKTDPNEAVREHATQVLLKWSTSPELAGETWNLKAFDDGFRKMALEWYGEHDPDKARSMCLQIVAHPDSEPLRITAIQVLGKVKESPGDHSVYEALIKVAQETTYGARREAINVLGQLGDKAAIAILQPITTHAPGGIRGAASAAIEKLNKQ